MTMDIEKARYWFCSNGCCGEGDWVRLRNGEIDASGGDVYDAMEKKLIIDPCCVVNYLDVDDPKYAEITTLWVEKHKDHLVPIPPLPDGFYSYDEKKKEWFPTTDWYGD